MRSSAARKNRHPSVIAFAGDFYGTRLRMVSRFAVGEDYYPVEHEEIVIAIGMGKREALRACKMYRTFFSHYPDIVISGILPE
jgi:hypothetical protein